MTDENGQSNEQEQEKRHPAEELLPWRVTGALDKEEQEMVDQALEANPALGEDVEFLKKLRAAVKGQPEVRSPGDFGLARLRRDINAQKAQAEQSVSAKILRAPVAGFWRPAAIAATLLVAVQIGIGLSQNTGDYRLAGGQTQQTLGPVMTVAFKPSASEAGIRALLRELNLTIIDGPSALGLYRVASNDKNARREPILVRLRAASMIVDTAEPE